MTEDIQAEETQMPAEPAVTAQPPEEKDTTSLFIESLAGSLSEEVVKSACRATEDGLFVAEEYVVDLILAYQKWLKEITGSASEKSTRKCKKRLFGTENPAPCYVIEGKQSRVGFLLDTRIKNPHKAGIPPYRGKTVSAEKYLHPKDPIFEQLRNVSASVEATGIQIHIEARRDTFHMSLQTLEKLAQVIRPPRKRDNDVLEASCSLRDILRRLSRLLPKAEYARRGDWLLVPLDEQKKVQKIFRLGTLVLFTSQDLVVESCYGISDRSYMRFVRDELEACAISGNKRGLKHLYFLKRRNIIGEVAKARGKYLLSEGAFMNFLEAMPAIHPRLKGFPRQYTVRDMLVALLELFHEAEEVLEPRPSARSRMEGQEENFSKHKVRNAFFLIAKNSTISRFTIAASRRGHYSKNRGKSPTAGQERRRSQPQRGKYRHRKKERR